MGFVKYFNFFREENNFNDILNDLSLKKHIVEKTSWYQWLRIAIPDDPKLASYITLKYGDEMRNNLTKDYSPVANVDYTPIRK